MFYHTLPVEIPLCKGLELKGIDNKTTQKK